MKNTINDRITQWRKSLTRLHWSPRHAERSARLALSRAAWLGLDQEEAIRTVFEMGLDEFFHENPQIPYHVWQSVSAQIHGHDEIALLAA